LKTFAAVLVALSLPLVGFSQAESGQQRYNLTDRGGVSLTSAGDSSTLKVGYARIRPEAGNSTPSGLAIFGFRQNGVLVSEAGVPGAPALHSARIYAEINGSVNTGLAIANPNPQDAIVSFYFTGPNGNFGSNTVRIPANRQMAAFLDQDPFRAPSPLTGTFTFASSVPIAVIAIRGLVNERGEFLITTLPVTDLSTPASTQPVVFPHFADGGGWTTQVMLVNASDDAINGTVQFLDQSGKPVGVIVDGQSNSSFAYSIAPRNSQKLRTAGTSSAIAVGSIRVASNAGGAAPAGLAVFTFRSGGFTVAEAGVPASPAGTAFRLYAEASGILGSLGSIETGLAVTNMSSSNAIVNVDLHRLDGSSIGLTGTISIPANGQRATFLSQVPGLGALGTPFQGVLRVASNQSIAVTGLRGRYNERGNFLITTTPAAKEAAPSSNAEMYFPHIADSGGYTTQFILFSGQAGQTSAGSMDFHAQSGTAWNLTVNPVGPGQAPPKRIAGVVAAGWPVAGMVYVLGANGAKASVQIEVDGSYNLDVSGLTTPYILYAKGTVSNEEITIYSAGVGPTINITPVTDFILRKAARRPAEDAWGNWTVTSVDPVALAAAESAVRSQLDPLLTAARVPTDFSLMTDPFTTDHTGIDLVLESVDIRYNQTGNVATVINKLTGSSYTDDVLSSADDQLARLPDTDFGRTQLAISDRDAIFVVFKSLTDLFADSAPDATELSAWFDRHVAVDFLSDQETRTEWLNQWLAGEAPPTGFQLSIDVLRPIDMAATPYVRGYSLHVAVEYQGEAVDHFETKVVYDGTRWLWWGDQMWVDLRLHPAALKSVLANGNVGFLTGLSVTVSEGVAYDRGVRSAIAFGPGLPAGGQILEHTLFPEPLFAPRGGTVVALDDNVISLIPDEATYRICLYREEPAAVSPASAPLACYETVLPKPPVRSAELNPLFPTLISPASHNHAVVTVPGLFEVTWANPANMQVEYVELGFWDATKSIMHRVRTRVEPGSTRATLDCSTIPPGLHASQLNLGGDDRYERSFDFWWFFN
jgi:peptidoglycan hydrolase-like protein with peptidoglycan-binding domain